MNRPILVNRTFAFLIFLFSFQQINAQYTEIINSKRPGFSESPYSIGTGVYQVESGFFYKKDNNPLNRYQTSYGGNIFLRYGRFSEKLEFNASMTYQWDKVSDITGPQVHSNPELEFNNVLPFSFFDRDGISELTIGAKYMFYQQEFKDKSKEIRSWKRKMAFDKSRLIPSVGFYAGVHTNFLGKEYKTDGLSYKAALLLQNDVNDRLVILTNLIMDDISTEEKYFSYIITMTYAVNEQWSYFVENQGVFKDPYPNFYQFGTGVAYLYSPDLQIDASVRTNFFDDYPFTYLAAGVAWRLDRHQDSFVYKNAKSTGIKTNSNRKGFFSRVFGGFFSKLFKKKRK